MIGGELVLTKNEQNVLELIKNNPYISQQMIADQLNIARSTVASVISGLTNKNYILGRAYVLHDQPSVYCIGAMNVDRKYVLDSELIMSTSNPATSDYSIGGVGRNIAENIGRMGQKVSMLSVAGNDNDYMWLKNQTSPYVNLDLVTVYNDYSTGSYSAVLDDSGDMQFAIADMSIYDTMTLDWIREYEHQLITADHIILDLNPPKETVEFIINVANEHDIDLSIVAVSGPKMNHLPDNLDGIDIIFVNADESEAYFNETLSNEMYVEKWLETGVKQVIVTSGSSPTIYGNTQGVVKHFSPPQPDKITDVTGAGDSYVAGFIFGHLNDKNYQQSMELAMTNAYHTIQTSDTVRTNLNKEQFYLDYTNLFTEGNS